MDCEKEQDRGGGEVLLYLQYIHLLSRSIDLLGVMIPRHHISHKFTIQILISPCSHVINVCVTMVTGDQAMDHMILGGVQFTHTIVYGFHRSMHAGSFHGHG